MPLWLNDVAEVVDPGGHNVVLELPKLSSLAPKCLNRRAFIFRPTLFSTSNLHDVAFTEIAFDSVTQLARWLVSATQLRTLHFAYCGFAKNSVFATGIRGDRSFEPLGQHSIEHSGSKLAPVTLDSVRPAACWRHIIQHLRIPPTTNIRMLARTTLTDPHNAEAPLLQGMAELLSTAQPPIELIILLLRPAQGY